MLHEFIRYLEAERRYSPLTVRNYRRDIERFLAWRGDDDATFDPRSVSADDIREWILHRSEADGVGAASMNRELSSLRSFFRWLHRTGRVEKEVMSRIPALRTPHRLPAFVPESRMTGIVGDCETESDAPLRERDSLIVLMLYACGLRLAELIGIDCDDFSDDYRTLRIRGKGDKERIVPVMEFVREKILRYLDLIRRQNICKSGEKALF